MACFLRKEKVRQHLAIRSYMSYTRIALWRKLRSSSISNPRSNWARHVRKRIWVPEIPWSEAALRL